MRSFSSVTNTDFIDNIIRSLYDKTASSILPTVTEHFESVIRALGSVLTPDQISVLLSLDEIKNVLRANSRVPGRAGYQGSIGGFGTEEMEESERP